MFLEVMKDSLSMMVTLMVSRPTLTLNLSDVSTMRARKYSTPSKMSSSLMSMRVGEDTVLRAGV